jgi:transposase InsO family protein
MDVKYLTDIPNYWPYMTDMSLPKFEYTTRCPRLGATFLTFANECSLTYAELTAKRLLRHLEQHGIAPETVSIQTDLGSEFDGQAMRKNDRGFTFTIEKLFEARHRHSPLHCPNANANVESFHSLVETEFFNIERFRNPQDFWVKINTYQNYFNLARHNSYKDWKSLLDILEDTAPQVARSIFLLPPVDLVTLLEPQLHPQGGTMYPTIPLETLDTTEVL